jgi:hypothetical protein
LTQVKLQCKILIFFCDFGQGLGISNDFFNSGQCGDTITWQGVSSVTPLDEVNITNINHSGGSNIFNHDKLPGNGRHPKSFRRCSKQRQGETEKYTILFNVF